MEKEEIVKQIGNNIKRLRKQRGISQAELSRMCYKDKQSMERIENGRTNPTVYTLFQIAKALEVKLEDLVKI